MNGLQMLVLERTPWQLLYSKLVCINQQNFWDLINVKKIKRRRFRSNCRLFEQWEEIKTLIIPE